MAHHDEYRQWPFLHEEEFDLACAFFDLRYVKAKMGKGRQAFKLRSRRIATTGTTYVEIVRFLQTPEDVDELSIALQRLGTDDKDGLEYSMEIEAEAEEADHEAFRPSDIPLAYSTYTNQPYVTYEIHLHPTYGIPTLWFTLHDLPFGETAFDIGAVYRYLVPDEYKTKLRSAGITGGLSAAPHPITDIPAFFIHPCQTQEAMQNFDCPLRDYIMVWIGLVGGCVGLWVPTEMAVE